MENLLCKPDASQHGHWLHTSRFSHGKQDSGDPSMTLSWLDWLLEKGERNSRSYDFIEERPFWTMWWFRISAVLAIIAILIIGIFFWPF